MDNFKGNFPSKYRKQGTSLKCKSCKNLLPGNQSLNDTNEVNIEQQSHFLEICPVFSDLRSEYDTDSDLGLIEFYRAVVARRIEDDEEA